MTTITFLGTASAVPNKEHQNTHFTVQSGENLMLVDCVGSPITRLEQAGIDPLAITDLILTHFHPDHVSGVPLLLLDLWLMGRKAALPIYGLEDVIDRFETIMDAFYWKEWEFEFPVELNRIPLQEMSPLIDREGFRVFGSPVFHAIPAMGIRVETADRVFSYSTDTRPCDAVVRLADHTDLLIHEATGPGTGHSLPPQAGEIAQKAGAKKLCLIHYNPDADIDKLVEEAQTTFDGEVFAALDLMKYEL
jgi:ribonuclease Z